MPSTLRVAALIRHAPAAPPVETITYRGTLARGWGANEFILRPEDPLGQIESGVFLRRDVVGRLPPLPRTGATRAVNDVRVRMGALMRVVRERTQRVGSDPGPMPALDQIERIAGSAIAADRVRAIRSAAASVLPSPARARVYVGVVIRGRRPGEFVLQREPRSREEWAVVPTDSVADGVIATLPRTLLRLVGSPVPVHAVAIRDGTLLRTFREKRCHVEDPPTAPPPGFDPVAWQGDCNATAGGTCPAPIVGAGYPCTTEGAMCDHFGLCPCRGSCHTVACSWHTCECECC